MKKGGGLPAGRDREGDVLPVYRARLPDADAVLPYLRRIDAGRIYSNWGPLVTELEGRLGDHFGLPAGALTTAASGTAALAGAILASAGRATVQKPRALIPAFTFVGTASAVEMCGYVPQLVDMDPKTWMLDPQALATRADLGRVGVVVAVAPFGKAVAQDDWRRFATATGVPVVIDGAACFEALAKDAGRLIGDIPVAVSFHATKSFGTGEGGCVICADTSLVRRAGQSLNFGFDDTREAASPNLNGKMAEYPAAVGLAELDGWQAKSRSLQKVSDCYRSLFHELALDEQFVSAPEVASNYALFVCRDASESDLVSASLARNRIGYRFWYGGGLHRHPYYSALPADALAFTEGLSKRILGIPTAPDLGLEAIQRVVIAVGDGVEAARC